MSPLREALTSYLTIRRALGYKLVRAGKLLTLFVAYMEDVGAKTVTTEHAIAWAKLPAGGGVNWWAHRLSVVRCFATYLHTLDPSAEVPAADLLPVRPQRATPYLYSDDEISSLIKACRCLRSPLRATTYQTLIGLLAVTGLRIGEAIGVDREDIDFDQGLLIVNEGKFGKSRELPLHPTTLRALRSYLRERDRLHPATGTPAFFVSTVGTRLIYCNVHWTFLRLVRFAGLKPRSTACRPRLHDLRHTFAVSTMLDAYRNGADVQARLPLLSTYLGHVNPTSTYWYLSAAPELLAMASGRLQSHWESRS